MMIHRLAATLALASAAILMGGCGSNVTLDENANKGAPVENRGAGAAAGSGAAAAGSNLPGERSVAQVNLPDPLNDPSGPLAKRSIYFDYDSFVVKDDFRGVVEAHSRYLTSHKNRKVVIQGNTDERGGREYNLALGQKRAEAVRRAMIALGVADSQIESVSFGEEKPKATGSDEAAYAENRRADLAYQ
jgi:peptidoglycan-associated lipoprotein